MLEDNDGVSTLPEPESQAAFSNLACLTRATPSSSDTSSHGIFESNNAGIPDANFAQQTVEEIVTTEQAPSTPMSQLLQGEENAIPEASLVWQKEYTCGFCIEQGFTTKCTRGNDLRRHIEGTHHSNNLWICSHKDCGRVFQWLGAYKIHVRSFHPGSRMRIGESKVVDLCPQTVFACGYDGCVKLFEARSALETAGTKKKYLDHIINHFRSMKKPKTWTFSNRIRNLLKQVDLVGVWPPGALSEEANVRLEWDAQTGGVLQKQLETRHLGDAASLIQNIIALGSNPGIEVQLAQANIAVPVLGECSEPVHHSNALTIPATAPAIALAIAPVMDSGNADNEASLVGPDYAAIANGGYQQQPLIYQDPMQQMLDSILLQPGEQQYNLAGWPESMEWATFDGEGNGRFM